MPAVQEAAGAEAAATVPRMSSMYRLVLMRLVHRRAGRAGVDEWTCLFLRPAGAARGGAIGWR